MVIRTRIAQITPETDSGEYIRFPGTFVGELAVSPTNNAAENALREPVILRKLIGTLRNERGMFIHKTALTLLATWGQQGQNPYEELQRVVRNNEMILADQAVPEVASA